MALILSVKLRINYALWMMKRSPWVLFRGACRCHLLIFQLNILVQLFKLHSSATASSPATASHKSNDAPPLCVCALSDRHKNAFITEGPDICTSAVRQQINCAIPLHVVSIYPVSLKSFNQPILCFLGVNFVNSLGLRLDI